MAIGFETGSGWYDRIAQKHHFFGRDGVEPIHCIISHAALAAVACDRSAATPSDLFDRVEHHVFTLAAKKFAASGCDPSGSLAINAEDLSLLVLR
jgi:hypothetical protein